MEDEYINSLNDGMHTDNDPSLQPPNTVRWARNGNIISKGQNYYAYESIDGTKVNFSLPLHKTGLTSKFTPIGWWRLGNNRLIIHSTDNKLTGGDGEIGIVTFDNKGYGIYSAKYYHADLKYSQAFMMRGYGLEENDTYHRNYWVDNNNQPRTINTASSVLNTVIPLGSIVNGETYMVLTDSIGTIEYPVASGNIYGPKQTLGNIFVGGATNTYSTNGFVKIIKYLDPNLLNYTPQRTVGEIDFVKYLFGGSLYCGVKLYTYQLGTEDGYETGWSYTTNPIHVSPSNPSSGYQAYTGGGYGNGLINSSKAIELVINNIPLGFTKIKVAVIEIDQQMNIIRNIEVFYNGSISGSSMNIIHYGKENLLPLSLDDIKLIKSVVLKAKDIDTDKQRQILVNLTERTELNWTPSATITHNIYTIPCDNAGLIVNGLEYNNVSPCPSTGIVSGSIRYGGHYVVRGTGSILYDGINYLAGKTFVGVSTSSTYTILSGIPIVKGCIRIKRYTTFAGDDIYKIIDLENEFFDYKSMATQSYLGGYWRDETYRIALLALDLMGNPYAVRFLKDELIPSQSDVSGNYGLINSVDPQFCLNILGLTINDLDITDIKDNISGISIVRVKRDATILGQGLVNQTVYHSSDIGTVSVPTSTSIPSNDYHVMAGSGATLGYVWNLIGPEFDTYSADFDIVLNPTDQLKPIADLSPVYSSGKNIAIDGVDQQIFSKYYNHNRFAGNAGNVILVHTLNPAEDFSYTAGGLPYVFKNYDIRTSAIHPDALGATGAGGLHDKGATGARSTIIISSYDFVNGVTGIGTGVNAVHNNTPRKLLANYVRPKGSSALYGGTTDAAKANNIYQFCGHYLPIDATMLATIKDGSNRYILNGMDIWGGDCYVQLYSRCLTLFNEYYNSHYSNNGSYSWGVIFPVESCMNANLREGPTIGRNKMQNYTGGIFFASSGVRRDEGYDYNGAYSSENNQITYAALPLDFYSVGRFPYMARYSQQKILGEVIDNMRIYLIYNFRNVDALHGEINACRVGAQDRLFYWQDKGFGYLAINEREQMSSALGGVIQLGVGGVMERFDTLGKYFGTQHMFSVIEFDAGFVWFDMRRRAFLLATYDGQAVNVGIVKGFESFFNNTFLDAEDNGYGNIFRFDQPLLGKGIIGVFNNKETIYMTFKFTQGIARAVEDFSLTRDFTVIFNTKLKQFIGITDCAPGNVIEHNGRVYLTKESRSSIIESMDYTVGMTISKDSQTYVCILPITTPTPLVAGNQPDVDTVHWKLASSEIDVHMAEAGDVCKFFGIVYPFEIQVSVNKDATTEKAFDVCEVYGNEVSLTDVEYETSKQTAADYNIAVKNKNFEYIDNSWWFNIALHKNKERLLDHYLLIKAKVKNYLTDPTVSLNKKKRIVYLKTIFRKKS